MASLIKWKRKDYLTLGRAISNFNKKINRLNAEEKKLYLPETIDYKEVKGKIYTRNELNRILNSLKRFSKAGAENPIITEGNRVLTKWEAKELRKEYKNSKKRITRNYYRVRKTYSFGIFKSSNGSI